MQRVPKPDNSPCSAMSKYLVLQSMPGWSRWGGCAFGVVGLCGIGYAPIQGPL